MLGPLVLWHWLALFAIAGRSWWAPGSCSPGQATRSRPVPVSAGCWWACSCSRPPLHFPKSQSTSARRSPGPRREWLDAWVDAGGGDVPTPVAPAASSRVPDRANPQRIARPARLDGSLDVDQRNELIRLAATTGADVETVAKHAALTNLGGVGGLLRYRIE